MSSTRTPPPPPTKYEYDQALVEIARAYMPKTYPCVHCHWPVVKGYCCNACGSTNPSSK